MAGCSPGPGARRPSASSSSARTGWAWALGRLAPRGRGRRPRRPPLLDGVVAREVIVADHVSAELLGPGDLLRPWQTPESSLLPVDVRVVCPLALVVRGPRPPLRGRARALARGHRRALRPPQRALAAARHHPGDLAAHARRPAAEGALLAPRRALGPRLRRRRRGPLALTHRILGQLVGARRPTVSTALGELAERGELTRRVDGSWVLRGSPPARPPSAAAAPSPAGRAT